MTRPRTYNGLTEVTEYVVPEPGHWLSKCCGAHCGPRDRTCWNCGKQRNRKRNAKITEEICQFEGCVIVYHVLDGCVGMCPFYFDHYGWNAYYSPDQRPDLLWDLNGYEFDDETRMVTKLKETAE